MNAKKEVIGIWGKVVIARMGIMKKGKFVKSALIIAKLAL